MDKTQIVLGSKKDRAYLMIGKFLITEEERKEVFLLAKTIPKKLATRRTRFYSDKAGKGNYLGYDREVFPLNTSLKNILERVNEETKGRFNGVAVMVYDNENHHIKKHTDREVRGIWEGVFCISLLENILDFREVVFETSQYSKDEERHEIIFEMGDSNFYWMAGENFQRKYTHELRKGAFPCKQRISLSFRYYPEFK